MIKQVNNLNELISLCINMKDYLKGKNMFFNENGFPIMKKDYFLEEYPEMVVPVTQWNNKLIKNKKKTAICFYCSDVFIYRRFANLFKEIDKYKGYMGVISPDLTVTYDMDLEWQRFIMLANFLFMAVLCVNGIKIILNTRSGGFNTIKIFDVIPQNIMCASSFLGCKKDGNYYSDDYINKILYLLPSKLILYGKKVDTEMLDNIGIDYKCFKDFHSLVKEVYKNER